MNKPQDEFFWLDKLSNSSAFTAPKDVELLRYLIQATHAEKNLKEATIALEFFGKDASFDPATDSIVRSNIYNLRKKLASYYLLDGTQDALQFSIPKGSYLVRFTHKKTATAGPPKPESQKQHKPSLKIPFLISLALMLIFAVLFFASRSNQNKNTQQEPSPIWEYYLHSESPLLIVLGDYFMMQKAELPDSSFTFVRNPAINNQEDFFRYLDRNPQDRQKLKKLGQNYLGEEIPRCLFRLFSIFQHSPKSIKLKYASELSLADLKEHDVIFVGDFSTLGILQPFFAKTGYSYSNTQSKIYTTDAQGNITESFLLDNPDQSVFQNDYAVAANIGSYQGKQVLFFVSFLPFGKSEALYKLQDPAFLPELSDSLTDLPATWSLLMKVSGLQSSGFYYEVVRFKEVR